MAFLRRTTWTTSSRPPRYVDKMKRELDGIVGRLAALPHAPVRVEPDVAPFRTWMNMHRVQFEEFKTYCDEYRPKSPREDGEVHPAVENMAGCVQRLTQRVDELAPLVYPEAFELQRRAEVLAEAHRRTGQVFWEAMGKFSLEELGEQGLRLAIEQRALQVAHATLDGIVRMREGPGETEVLCWLEPVDSQNGEAVDENMELDELEGWW
ncbi:hypothetical protein B0H15DRAFT_629334 [Mycena belliarum]|uniref:Uncharacterized protein n=1 Tax=Mycena belliarum TaxID=1033014 RepID=A0AAD6XV18_9AGAR|nr:hypothetical protein B0H15DRAFT_629334 [Mycena belliae]